MHNKYCIIDEKILITGSYNWTIKATTLNRENILIIEDEATAKAYKDNFDLMWNDFVDHKIDATK